MNEIYNIETKLGISFQREERDDDSPPPREEPKSGGKPKTSLTRKSTLKSP